MNWFISQLSLRWSASVSKIDVYKWKGRDVRNMTCYTEKIVSTAICQTCTHWFLPIINCRDVRRFTSFISQRKKLSGRHWSVSAFGKNSFQSKHNGNVDWMIGLHVTQLVRFGVGYILGWESQDKECMWTVSWQSFDGDSEHSCCWSSLVCNPCKVYVLPQTERQTHDT